MSAKTRKDAVRTRSRVGSWFDHHVYSLVASLGRVLRKPWSTGLTVGVIQRIFAIPLRDEIDETSVAQGLTSSRGDLVNTWFFFGPLGGDRHDGGDDFVDRDDVERALG